MKVTLGELEEGSVKESMDFSRDECVKERAYEIYLERGDSPGSEIEDWLQAEAEIGIKGDRDSDSTSRAGSATAA